MLEETGVGVWIFWLYFEGMKYRWGDKRLIGGVGDGDVSGNVPNHRKGMAQRVFAVQRIEEVGVIGCLIDGTGCGKVINGDYMDVDIFGCGVFLNGF